MDKVLYVVPKDSSKKERMMAWLKNKKAEAECWWQENKEVVMVIAPPAIGAGTLLIKVISRRHRLHMEEQLKTKMIYDPSRGFYYELKKKLSNAQRIEIARRRNQGEDLARILLDMNVLKGL